eukprot:CAMPEP_0202947446 /NCGR_PEP_ID=MMETSP1395-20130829/11603_1 /ASSEMBLY_ACC=CAM_ASM_000871 /TAXON_ID=5961 /ORGANISM="Blepharisma japonicum, Strain Stock R1072" /LENGTH=109 /DNA_ID=CAMNT_0049648705 /DNA_START=911 /DNA_END=1240 /DNA_ORIENTATION=-
MGFVLAMMDFTQTQFKELPFAMLVEMAATSAPQLPLAKAVKTKIQALNQMDLAVAIAASMLPRLHQIHFLALLVNLPAVTVQMDNAMLVKTQMHPHLRHLASAMMDFTV